MSDTIRDNAFLFATVAVGGIILSIGYYPPYHDMLIALGAAFIIAGAVGIYMMLATRQVAKKLLVMVRDDPTIIIATNITFCRRIRLVLIFSELFGSVMIFFVMLQAS